MNERPIRVLHLIHWLKLGGIERWLLDLLAEAPRTSIVMDVCCKGPELGPLVGDATRTGATVYHCPLRATVFPFVRQLARILHEGEFDILHAHVNSHMVPAMAAARRAGVRAIATVHSERMLPRARWLQLPMVRDLYRRYAAWGTTRSIQQATLLAPVSRAVARRTYGEHCDQLKKLRVCYLGARPPCLVGPEQLETLRQSLGIHGSQPIVLHAGSFQTSKNHRGLLQILARVLARFPHAVLLLAGDGPQRPAVEEYVGLDPQLRGRVQFLGFRNDVTRLMQLSDVFVFPSLYEGLPVVLMEAMACGLPIVASDIPSNREALGPLGPVTTRPCQDVAGLADLVIRVLKEADWRSELIAIGQNRFQQLFSLRASWDRLQSLYRECLLQPVST